MKITLTQDAYPCSGFYHFHNENGDETGYGLSSWFEANAVDVSGNEYRIIWEINDEKAFSEGDYDCCDWDTPVEIYSYETHKPISLREVDIQFN